MNLTIVVPTLNRNDKFTKLLEYYSLNNYDGFILVIYSSNLKEKKKNILSIKKFPNLQIKYIFLTKKYYRKNFLKYVQKIKTKYIVYSGDDDFFLIASLKYLIKFLNKNSLYDGACGIGLIFLKYKNKYRTYLYKNLLEADHKISIERLKRQFTNKYTVVIYSVIRTSIWKSLKVPGFYQTNRSAMSEYFYTLSLVYLARIKQFNKLIYLLRSIDHKRYSLNEIPTKKEIFYFSKIFNKMMKNNNNFDYKKNKNIILELFEKKQKKMKNRLIFSFLKIAKNFKNYLHGRKMQNFIDILKINKFYSPKYSVESLINRKNKFQCLKEFKLFIEFLKKNNY
jgi:glycosyltransferase domain-containing protein